MAEEWFFRVSFAELGPFSLAEMGAFLQSGRIDRDTLVRLGENGKWVKVAEVQALSGFVAKPPTPPAGPSSAAGAKPPAAPKQAVSKPAPPRSAGANLSSQAAKSPGAIPPARPGQRTAGGGNPPLPGGGQRDAGRPAKPPAGVGRPATAPPTGQRPMPGPGQSAAPPRPKQPARPADPRPATPAARPKPDPLALPPGFHEGLPPFRDEPPSDAPPEDEASGGAQAPVAPAKKPAQRAGKKGIFAADLLAAIEPPPSEPEPEPAPEPEPEPKEKFQLQFPRLELNRNKLILYAACAAVAGVGLVIAIVTTKMQARERAISPEALAKIPVMDRLDIPTVDAPATVAEAAPGASEPADAAPPPMDLPAATTAAAPKAADPNAKYSTEEIVNRCENSVAMVKGGRGSGSGFLVRPGVLITNKHVVAQELMSGVQVFFPSCPAAERGPFAASLIYEDPALDIAVLKTAAPQKPLSIAANYQFRRGHEVTVIGNPGALDGLVLQNAVSRGIMSTEATIEGLPYYQLSIAINPGNSGGPVFDDHADVIGVVTLKAANKESIGFCIPLYKLREVLDRVDRLGPRQIDLADSRHRARVVFVVARSLGQAYQELAAMQAAEMNEILERAKITQRVAGRRRGAGPMLQDPGRNMPLQVDKEAKERAHKLLAKYDSAMLRDLPSEANLVVGDQNLNDDERTQFQEYWANFMELKQAAEEPRGGFEIYLKRFAELEAKRKGLGERLQKTLGLAPADGQR